METVRPTTAQFPISVPFVPIYVLPPRTPTEQQAFAFCTEGCPRLVSCSDKKYGQTKALTHHQHIGPLLILNCHLSVIIATLQDVWVFSQMGFVHIIKQPKENGK